MMKSAILIAGILAFTVSCSSSGKKDTATTAAPAVPATVTPSPTPTPKPDAQKAAQEVGCKKDLDTRTIAILSKGEGCEVQYTKSKVTTPIASSAKGTTHCEDIAKRIRTNLENGGFKCE